MSVHLDEEQFERDLRRVFAEMSADPQQHTKSSMILDRNRELSVQFGMMCCREINLGTDVEDIAAGGTMAFCEFFANILGNIEEHRRTALAEAIASEVVNAFADLLEGGSSFQFGEPATPQETPSGRA